MMNMISYCDGRHTLLDIAEKLNVPFGQLRSQLNPLLENGLVRVDNDHSDSELSNNNEHT